MVDIHIDSGGAFPIARVTGELTGSGNEGFVEDLHPLVCSDGAKIVLELSGVNMIDSSGLSSIMNIVSRARLTQGIVVLVAPSPFVSGVFSATRLDAWLDICRTVEEAVTRLNA